MIHIYVMRVRFGDSDILDMVQRAQNKALRITNFKEERHSSVPIFTKTKVILLISPP